MNFLETLHAFSYWLWPLLCFSAAWYFHRDVINNPDFYGDRISDLMRNGMLAAGVVGLVLAISDTFWFFV